LSIAGTQEKTAEAARALDRIPYHMSMGLGPSLECESGYGTLYHIVTLIVSLQGTLDRFIRQASKVS